MKERRIKAAVPEGERHNDGDGGCATRSRPAWGAKRDRREENEEESHGGLAGGGSRVGPSAVLPVSAAEAWTLPSAGIRMDMQTRQTYMNEKWKPFPSAGRRAETGGFCSARRLDVGAVFRERCRGGAACES